MPAQLIDLQVPRQSSLKQFFAHVPVIFPWLLKSTVEGNKTAPVDATKTSLGTNKNSNEKLVIKWVVCSATMLSSAI